MTKCTFHDYSSAGVINAKDAICVLPFNMVNEKIYVFLWYWSGFLAIITTLHLASRFVTIGSKSFRKHQALKHVRGITRQKLTFILAKCGFGDWLILLRLLENIDAIVMREILNELWVELGGAHGQYRNRLAKPIQPEKIGAEDVDDVESGSTGMFPELIKCGKPSRV